MEPLPADLFFSGKLRFTDGLPEGNPGQPAVPAVFSLHEPKDENGKKTGYFRNHVAEGTPEGKEKQIRAGHLYTVPSTVETLVHFQTQFTTQMKTAIKPSSGNAPAEGQLFGYQAIPAGSIFYASIQASDQDTLAKASQLVTGVQHLGRSRSAEYGEVSIEAIPAPEQPEALAHKTDSPDSFQILLLSDLCLSTQGSPTLLPTPSHFGLPEGTRFVPESSHIRTRSYSPWIQWRDGYDLERQVLSRGSVLHFEGNLPDEEARKLSVRLDNGIGLFSQEGLGRGLLNPAFLKTGTFQKTKQAPKQKAQTKAIDPGSLLTKVANQRYTRNSLSMELGPESKKLADSIYGGLKNLFNELSDYPGKSQWGNVRGFAAKHYKDTQKLKDALRYDMAKVSRDSKKENDKSKRIWTEEIIIPGHGRQSLVDFLCNKIVSHEHGPQLLALVANEVARRLAQNPIH